MFLGRGGPGVQCGAHVVPLPVQSSLLLSESGLVVSDLTRHPALAVCIDGADEIDPKLALIKVCTRWSHALHTRVPPQALTSLSSRAEAVATRRRKQLPQRPGSSS